MVGWMTFGDGDKEAIAFCAPLAPRIQTHLNPGFPTFDLRHACRHLQVRVHWGGPEQTNAVGGGDRTGRFGLIAGFHERHRCGPVSVAIQQGADDASVHHARKGMVVWLGTKHSHQFLAFAVRIDAKPV